MAMSLFKGGFLQRMWTSTGYDVIKGLSIWDGVAHRWFPSCVIITVIWTQQRRFSPLNWSQTFLFDKRAILKLSNSTLINQPYTDVNTQKCNRIINENMMYIYLNTYFYLNDLLNETALAAFYSYIFCFFPYVSNVYNNMYLFWIT